MKLLPHRRAAIRSVVVFALALPFLSGGALQAQDILRINCGAQQAATLDGGPAWERDTRLKPHPALNPDDSLTWVNNLPGATDPSVPAYVPANVFHSERFDQDGTVPMSYSVAVPAGTQVEVRLFFRNAWPGTQNPGDRVFDVSLDGQVVLDDYDVVADVGHMVGTMKSFVVTSDGSVDVEFGRITDNPLINAIEVIPQPLYRINCGGRDNDPADSASIWERDTRLKPHVTLNPGSNSVTWINNTAGTSDASVPAHIPAELFQSERSDTPSGTEISYALGAPAGATVEVRLFFRSTWPGTANPGQRVFDVLLDGQLVLDDYDIVADVGHLVGTMKSFQVLSDGIVDLQLLPVVGNPLINGIEVVTDASAGELVWAQDPLDLGEVDAGQMASAQLLLEHNGSPGANPITILGATISGPDAADFGHDLTTPQVLSGGDSLFVTFDFAPATVGAKQATLELALDSGPNLTLGLLGTANSGEVPLFRLNCGGKAVASIDSGPAWDRDTRLKPHPTLNPGSDSLTWTNNTGGATDPTVPSHVPGDLFGAERFDTDPSVEMSYSFAVPAGQLLEVRLFLRNTWPGTSSPGQRQFDVTIDGQLVLDDYDIVADVGHLVGTMQAFQVTSDGSVDVEFLHELDNPLINGIEVVSIPDPGAVVWSEDPVDFGTIDTSSSAQFPLTLDHTGSPGLNPITIEDVVVTGTDAADFDHDIAFPLTLVGGDSLAVVLDFDPTTAGAKQATLELTLDSGPALLLSLLGTAQDPPGGGVPFYRINCGGPTATTLDQFMDWSVDTDPSPSQNNNGGGTSWINNIAGTVDSSVPATVPGSVFESERWDPSSAPSLSYSFPVPQGTLVEVLLFFRNSFSGTSQVGERVFDVSIDGQIVMNDYDVVADVGHLVGTMKTFTLMSDGSVDIAFSHEVENPLINAIEIRAAAGGGANFLAMTPPTVLFPPTVTGGNATAEVLLANNAVSGPAITVNSMSIDGVDASEFAHDFAGPVILNPGESTTFEVTFLPTEVGALTARVVADHTGSNLAASDLSGEGSGAIAFQKANVPGAGLQNPTSLQFGPDDRLYVAELSGLIKAFTIVRNGPLDYDITNVEVISETHAIANFNDDGTFAPDIVERSMTGMYVTGTASNPVIYVSTCDPRQDLDVLDTNSGVISRLTWNGSSWDMVDLVRGLPRSYHNHWVNGLFLDEATNILYAASGGHTNRGAPSNNFALLPEYALSACILSIDLNAIGSSTYDIPTLDDEDRVGASDANDPFGGNAGKNQAIVVPGGPVQVYSPGHRNSYDVVITQGGLMYTVSNGPNAGWGGEPITSMGSCTNGINEAGVTLPDGLHLISGPGYYGGHPNPTRADTANTFNGTNPQSPVPGGNLVECEARIPGVNDGALAVFPTSTNGICEYTASNFSSLMQGNLLMVSFNGPVRRVELNAAGDEATNVTDLFSNTTGLALDITTLDDDGVFPGTIWVCGFNGGLVVFEPDDFFSCLGTYDVALDEDQDGFSNADEIDNGTNPCSAADTPSDWDGDFLSDLNDPDDDNDGIGDSVDVLALDATNGAGTLLPIDFQWDNSNEGGLLNMGFTGLMSDGVSDYMTLFDPSNMTIAGAAGVTTIDAVPSGTAAGNVNTQEYAFQVGADLSLEEGPFVVHGQVLSPYSGISPQAGQAQGIYIGSGDQDNYAQLTVAGAGGIEFSIENGGALSVFPLDPLTLPGPEEIDLFLVVDPIQATVQPCYRVTVGGVPGSIVTLTTPQTIPIGWIQTQFVTGIIATSAGAATFPATWGFFSVSSSRDGAWGSGTNLPIAVGEVACGVIGDTMYVVGESSNATQAYDLTTQTWSSGLAVRPFVGHHHAAETYDGLWYLVGGLGGGEGRVQIYDPIANSWSLGMDMPWSGGSVSTALIGDKIYAAGGIVGSTTVDDCAVYDIAADTWTMLASMPTQKGRNHAASGTDGKRLFVFGGRGIGSGAGNTVANGFDDLQVYDPATDTWDASSVGGSTLAPLPIGRGGMGKAVYFQSRFYVMGGETLDGPGAQPGNVYDRVDVYDPVTNTWTLDAPLPTPRHGIFPVVYENSILVPGGGVIAGFSKSAVLELYTR